jgi:hypothetical protein
MTEEAHPYRAEPDRAFADRLERELVRRLAVDRPHAAPAAGPLVEPLPPIDLDELEGGRSTVTVIDIAPMSWRGTPGRRRGPLLLVAAAVVALVALIAGGAFALLARDDPNNVGVPARPGPVSDGSLPPPGGATPSTALSQGGFQVPPDPRELVAAFDQFAVGGLYPTRHVYVYADGRVIRGPGSGPSDASGAENSPGIGFVEQRLTPLGAQLVQAEIISTGLFTGTPPAGSAMTVLDEPISMEAAGPLGYPPVIRVRDGDRLLSLAKQLDQGWTDEFGQLADRLWDLQSWLPASAWEDKAIREYVPSDYAACLERGSSSAAADAAIVDPLPAPAAELFAAPPSDGGGSVSPRCVDLTVDEVRQLGEALEAAGFVRSDAPPVGFAYSHHDQTQNISQDVSVRLTPELPHGEMAECCGGIDVLWVVDAVRRGEFPPLP